MKREALTPANVADIFSQLSLVTEGFTECASPRTYYLIRRRYGLTDKMIERMEVRFGKAVQHTINDTTVRQRRPPTRR